MTTPRLAAIAIIYVIAALAWGALGTSVVVRSGESDARLSREVVRLWGGRQTQVAPEVWLERPGTVTDAVEPHDDGGRPVAREVTQTMTERVPLALDSSRVRVRLELEHRKKGLLWYDTYAVRLRAVYRVRNPDAVARPVVAHLTFPSAEVQFDNFIFRLAGHDAARAEDFSKGATVRVELPPNTEAMLELAYDSRGLDEWMYAFGREGVTQVTDFTLTLATDFDRIDFPAGTISPSRRRVVPGGHELTWRFDSLLTGQRLGMDLPNRLNPGPLAARITYFAPVSLLFFLAVMVMVGLLTDRNLHPMNYAFVSAAFFAFHVLLAYLVDHVDIHVSLALASATSIVLVVSYLRLVAGPRFAFARAGLAQLVFLVLFSYAFFLEGYTGLTVTVGAILTLFVMMQLTARLDWGAVFEGRPEGVR